MFILIYVLNYNYNLIYIHIYYMDLNNLFLISGHGTIRQRPIVPSSANAESDPILNDDDVDFRMLSNHELFTLPENVSIVFFTNIGTFIGNQQCDIECKLFDFNYESADKAFNILTESININEYKFEIPSYTSNEIEYVRYNYGSVECPNLNIDFTDPILNFEPTNNEMIIKNSFMHVQKTGLFKYPLNTNNFYVNECEGKTNYGISTLDIYFTDNFINDIKSFQSLKIDKKDINSYIDCFKELYLDEFIDDEDNDDDDDDEDLTIKHIEFNIEGVFKNEMDRNIQLDKAPVDSLIVDKKIYKLSDLCNFVSANYMGKNIIFVYACRGHMDNDEYIDEMFDRYKQKIDEYVNKIEAYSEKNGEYDEVVLREYTKLMKNLKNIRDNNDSNKKIKNLYKKMEQKYGTIIEDKKKKN